MPLREFTRLTDRLLHRLGEEAILRGETVDPVRRIPIQHGVEFTDENGMALATRSLATLNKIDGPHARGDSILLVDGGNYFVLDALVRDNGYSQEWSIRGETAP